MYLLAQRMDLPISFAAANVVMAFTGVVLTLPNSPGLVGQFHAAIKAGLLAYLPAAIVNTRGIAYAIVLHGVQAIWYVGVGLISMVALSRTGAHARLRDAVRQSADRIRRLNDGGAMAAANAGVRASPRSSGAPSSTDSPSFTRMAVTRPAAVDSTGISIFIDSRMTTVWPSTTVSPVLTSIFQTVPVMCALTMLAMGHRE